VLENAVIPDGTIFKIVMSSSFELELKEMMNFNFNF